MSGVFTFEAMDDRIFQQYLRVHSVSTDTRKIESGTIFFALKGENFNGNKFAAQALQLGASMVVADEETGIEDSRIVMVKDALAALQKLAGDYRKTLNIPFLAITGSNGKTTTKELIREVMRKKFKVSATIGNLNNHIGVPLTILSIPVDCEFAIIEMGANHIGEIAGYCEYTAPSCGLVTNMGKAHLEGFGGEAGVVKGKGELYRYLHHHEGVIFVNSELEKLKLATEGMSIVAYGFNTGGFQLECISESPTLNYHYASDEFSGHFSTHLAGAYNLYNIASALCVGKYFGVKQNDMHDAICAYVPDNNRSQIKNTLHNMLILDAYNANPSSLEYALLSLSKQEIPNKFFVIGDMRELGDQGPEEHRRILQVAKDLGLDGITVGPIFSQLKSENPFQSFTDNMEAKLFLQNRQIKNAIILIKGSRGIRLEEVVEVL